MIDGDKQNLLLRQANVIRSRKNRLHREQHQLLETARKVLNQVEGQIQVPLALRLLCENNHSDLSMQLFNVHLEIGELEKEFRDCVGSIQRAACAR